MRKIISNTTPIISLLKVDKLDLLKELYEKVIVPIKNILHAAVSST